MQASPTADPVLPPLPCLLQVVLVGDMNIASEQRDVHPTFNFQSCYSPQEVQLLHGMMQVGSCTGLDGCLGDVCASPALLGEHSSPRWPHALAEYAERLCGSCMSADA